MSRCILAAAELPDEAALVTAAGAQGIGITRRCVDAVDLLAAAAADPSMPIVLTAGMPRLTADLVQRLRAGGRTIIGLIAAVDDEQRLRAWGIGEHIRLSGDPTASMRQVALALEQAPDGVWTIADACGPTPARRPGRLIAVWGPSGAPGRTTTAIALGETLAALGMRTCIVDADLRSPTMIAQLGVVDDVSGIVIACRHAEGATLSPRSLTQCTRELAPGLAVLGGLSRPDRWPDVREPALCAVVEEAASVFDAVVVDVGALDNPASGADPLAMSRGAPGVAITESADALLVVARMSTLGAVRLLGELAVLPREATVVALTGAPIARSGALDSELTRLLRAAGVHAPTLVIARRPERLERAVSAGIMPREAASRRERRQLGAVAEQLLGTEDLRGTEARRRGRRR